MLHFVLIFWISAWLAFWRSHTVVKQLHELLREPAGQDGIQPAMLLLHVWLEKWGKGLGEEDCVALLCFRIIILAVASLFTWRHAEKSYMCGYKILWFDRYWIPRSSNFFCDLGSLTNYQSSSRLRPLEQGWPTLATDPHMAQAAFACGMWQIGEGTGSTIVDGAWSRKQSSNLARQHRVGSRQLSSSLGTGKWLEWDLRRMWG